MAPACMTHNRFDVYADLILPLANFLTGDDFVDSDEEVEEKQLDNDVKL